MPLFTSRFWRTPSSTGTVIGPTLQVTSTPLHLRLRDVRLPVAGGRILVVMEPDRAGIEVDEDRRSVDRRRSPFQRMRRLGRVPRCRWRWARDATLDTRVVGANYRAKVSAKAAPRAGKNTTTGGIRVYRPQRWQPHPPGRRRSRAFCRRLRRERTTLCARILRPPHPPSSVVIAEARRIVPRPCRFRLHGEWHTLLPGQPRLR